MKKIATLKKVVKKSTQKSWADKMEQGHSVVKKLDKDFADMKAGSLM